jgi:hypothetical protein
MALVSAHLGAVIASPNPPPVRELALVHRAGALSPAAMRYVELAVPEPGDSIATDLGDTEATAAGRGVAG